MNRNIKSTHFIAKGNHFLKNLSAYTLKEVCGCGLSFAFFRLKEELGVVTLYDQETIEILSQVINKMRRLSSPLSMKQEEYKSFLLKREKLQNQCVHYRSLLLQGTKPITIYKLLDYQSSNAYIVSCYGKKLEIADIRNELLNDTKALKRKYSQIVKDAEKGAFLRIPYEDTYMIRASLNDKAEISEKIQSDSEELIISDKIRCCLDGIVDVPSQTKQKDRMILFSDIEVLDEYIEYKKEVKKIASNKDKSILDKMHLEDEIMIRLSKAIEAIKIPSFKA